MSKKWKRLLIIFAGMAGLSVLSFNCAPHLLQSAKLSAASLGNGNNNLSDPFAKANSPYSIMTANELYQSMLNVTGQTEQATNSESSEYMSREVLLGTTNSINAVNGPTLIATTSLAGEVCNGLISKEKAMSAANRKFFTQVDFTKGLSSNTLAAYSASVDAMATAFWGHSPTSDETSILQSYYNDFVSQLSSTQQGQSTETSALYLSVCSGMLSSFDSVTL